MRIKRFFFLAILVLLQYSAIGQVDIRLISHLPHQDTSSRGTDVWGYVNPDNGKEYALLGTFNTFSVIDVSEPENPRYVAFFPNVKGFDIKVWSHYAYSCGGNDNGRMKIVDLANPEAPVVVGDLRNAHNLWIDEKGYLYAAFKGIRIYDLNQNPENPPLIWQDTLLGGHDIAVFGDRIFFFEGYNGTFIYDAPDRSNPQLVAQITDPQIQYHHSGWLGYRENILYICDELAKTPNADISIWDISDLGNITRIGDFEDPQAIVHNIYVKDRYAFVSYYKKGFRVFDLTERDQLKLEATYPTFTGTPDENFDGAFGVYPYSPTGYFMVNDMSNGFFLFDARRLPDTQLTVTGTVWPNPFDESVRMVWEIDEDAQALVEIFDVQGRRVAIPFSGLLEQGFSWVEWDGNVGNTGLPAAPGIYYARLKVGQDKAGYQATKLVKQR